MRTRSTPVALAIVLAASLAGPVLSAGQPEISWRTFVEAASSDRRVQRAALEAIGARWRDGYTPMLIDGIRFLPSPRLFQGGGPAEDPAQGDGIEGPPLPPQAAASGQGPTATRLMAAEARGRVTAFLERQTGQKFGDDLRRWRRWMWSRPYDPHPDYAELKAELYGRIDQRFSAFFPSRVDARIRLDEIDWGGVPVNGIPPLRRPMHVGAPAATWLRDSHIVFGLVVNGEARAYPRRILAWHELATDTLGGVDLALVYCTLCGTVIPYDSRADGRSFTFGTSGLLYRSNKLMFDEETGSLWSSLEGIPVVGPLASSGLRLAVRPVVTTTWGEWRRDHPSTTVVSLDTGYRRDYAEGAAYREYFATDALMFEVPTTDRRLKNKAEVLVLRPEVVGQGSSGVAIAVDRLARQPLLAIEAGGRALLVVTSKAGANRVYERGGETFVAIESDGRVRDASGRLWTITPDAMVLEGASPLARVPAHRAFWFGWVAQHPDTALYR